MQLQLTEPLVSPIKIDESHELAEFFLKPFTLDKAPLLRVAFATAGQHQYLVLCCHHLIMDAWSVGLLLQSLASDLPANSYDYASYISHEKSDLQNYQNEFIYWEKRLKNQSWGVDLVNDYPRVKYLSGAGQTEWLKVPVDFFESIVNYAKVNQVSVNHVILSAFQLLLARYSNQDEIMLGMPIAGREHSQWHNIIGLFVNTFLHVCKIDYQVSFKEHLLATKTQLIEDLTHANLPFNHLMSYLYQHQQCSQGASFNILYNFIQTTDQANLLLCLLPLSKFDLSLHIMMNNHELILLMEYSTQLFFKETIKQLLQDLFTYLKTFIINDQCLLTDLIWTLNNNH